VAHAIPIFHPPHRVAASLYAAALRASSKKTAQKRIAMVKTGLFVRLEAKPGKEEEVANFLKGGLAVVDGEPATITWFAIRMSSSTFGIFDAFPDEAGRQAHLTGPLAAALMANADTLLSQRPSIEKVDVLASKMPGSK
jgi:quinol monooxygenase YgiN